MSTDQKYWQKVLAESTKHISNGWTNQAEIFPAGLFGAQRALRCGRRPPDLAEGHKMWP